MDYISAILGELAAKYPALMTVFVIVGILRAVNKPLFALLHAYVEATPSDKDDAALKKAEESKGIKTVMWVLDYLASVKMKK